MNICVCYDVIVCSFCCNGMIIVDEFVEEVGVLRWMILCDIGVLCDEGFVIYFELGCGGGLFFDFGLV